MNLDEYCRTFSSEEDLPGWDAIDSCLRALYLSQKPQHWAPVPHYAAGGNDPLDGISMYKAGTGDTEHLHFITYGFSSLYYDEEAAGQDFSRFGFELTFRLRRFEEDDDTPWWVFAMLQNIARYVFKSGNWFEQYHHLDAKGPIRLNTETDIVALAFVRDPELGVIDSPHGQVEFIQAFGITTREFEGIKSGALTVEAVLASEHIQNPLWITDLLRKNR